MNTAPKPWSRMVILEDHHSTFPVLIMPDQEFDENFKAWDLSRDDFFTVDVSALASIHEVSRTIN